MATTTINGVKLFYELNGTGGTPLVLVHGSWTSHHTWDAVVPRLAESFQVLTYDRRGHSQSERPAGQGSVQEDVADLAALIEHLELAPAWVVGNSFGASITLWFAGKHPDLVQGVVAHEPPLFSLLADDPATAPVLDEIEQKTRVVAERIASGDHAGAAQHFINAVALGPGSWAQLPPDFQKTLIENAPTFLDETNDPEQIVLDVEELQQFSKPALLTLGEKSPPIFMPVAAKLQEAVPHLEMATYNGAGHVPHLTHPDAYIETVTTFAQKHGI